MPKPLHNLADAYSPIQRAEWARENVRIAGQNLREALDAVRAALDLADTAADAAKTVVPKTAWLSTKGKHKRVHTSRCANVSRTLNLLDGAESHTFVVIPMAVALDYIERGRYEDCQACAKRRQAEVTV